MKNQATSKELLEAIKLKNGLKTDYQLGKYMVATYQNGWTQQTVSRFMSDSPTTARPVPDAKALDIAEELNLDPVYVIAAMKAGREKNERVKKAWEHAADLAQQSVALTLLLLVLSVPSPAYAQDKSETLYIMLNDRLCTFGFKAFCTKKVCHSPVPAHSKYAVYRFDI